ncbi:hypothetical protein NK718_18365 [Alsobacter sp. SYSU M60028]|uniref:Transmembrane protein n=1 Tax=Alsobacter ponti TaxID=2962936 RepID=A0ABT1LGD0_9HYPH|nr:hypothetical protein [Alsobacter ponti]MCP8940494.1 hypothetical protein [Alsobacter ponti]
MQRLLRPLWFVLAALFLFEAWLWDIFAALADRVLAVLPWKPVREAIARGVARLPPWLTLFVFVIPALVVFPFKLLGLWLIGTGRPILGVATFFVAKTAGLGSAAFLFEVCRPNLMRLAWFVRVYDLAVRVRAWAHRQVEPFRVRLRAAMARLRARFAADPRWRRQLRRWRRTVQARRRAAPR